MPWLQYSGHTPAEFPMNISGGGGVSSTLLQPHDKWAAIIKQIAPAIKQYVDQKRADEIANEVLNMETPPRAEAVDPSIQGAPATAPARGGANWLKAQQLYQQHLDSQPDTATDDLNYQILWNKAHPDEQADSPPRGPQYVDTPYGRMTAQQWMDYQRKQVRGEGGLPKGVTMEMYQNSKTQNFNPSQAFRDAQRRMQTLPEPDLPPVSEEQPTSAPAMKQLDAATAKAILAEVGGDKEKARQLARERGYSF
jgi:hypothetical protein